MGTRGTWGFVLGDEEKLTYNHFDSYPEGLGNDLLESLREQIAESGLDGLRAAVNNLALVDETEPPTPEQQERLAAFADTGVSAGSLGEWYVLLRTTQGDLKLTLESGVILDGNDFATDSLFCEYGYVIDLDKGTFEVYKGFQHGPPTEGRFASRVVPEGSKYYPINLIASFPLDNLPSKEEFFRATHDSDEDDEEVE